MHWRGSSQGLGALRDVEPAYVGLGSWLGKNLVARRGDSIRLPSDRYSRREDSPGLSISINQRKIILLVFEFSGFSHRLGLGCVKTRWCGEPIEWTFRHRRSRRAHVFDG